MFWLVLIIGFFSLIYLYLIRRLQYWRNLQIPQHSVAKIIIDNIATVIPTKSISESLKQLYNDFPDQRYFGCYLFMSPSLFIRDPELIKQMTIKDFEHFTDRTALATEETEPTWGKSLLTLSGEKWKNLRPILSPSFTGFKLKIMCPLITDCIKQLLNHLDQDNSETINIEAKEIFKRLGCDVIATSSFGISRNSFEDPDNDFWTMAKQMTNFNFTVYIRVLFKLVCPKLANALNIQTMDKNVTKFFENIILENIKARETKGIVRPDMIQLLLEAKRNSNTTNEDIYEEETEIFKKYESKEKKASKFQLTDDYILGQALIFFIAGHEGISVAMSFLAYELALNPEIQDKLHQEIQENINKFGADPTYENLMKMKYLDMVVSESLRKASLNPVVDRVCTKPYNIQPKHENEKLVHFKVGDKFLFSASPMHYDPQYFPNPDVFDPERFSNENKFKITPGTYVPFGIGPRYCIGTRFALFEIKLSFFHILAKYKVVVIDKTPIPLKLAKKQFIVDAEGGFWVGLQKRTA